MKSCTLQPQVITVLRISMRHPFRSLEAVTTQPPPRRRQFGFRAGPSRPCRVTQGELATCLSFRPVWPIRPPRCGHGRPPGSSSGSDQGPRATGQVSRRPEPCYGRARDIKDMHLLTTTASWAVSGPGSRHAEHALRGLTDRAVVFRSVRT